MPKIANQSLSSKIVEHKSSTYKNITSRKKTTNTSKSCNSYNVNGQIETTVEYSISQAWNSELCQNETYVGGKTIGGITGK